MPWNRHSKFCRGKFCHSAGDDVLAPLVRASPSPCGHASVAPLSTTRSNVPDEHRQLEVTSMDDDSRLRRLESRYRAALSAAGAAQARYFMLAGEPNASAAAIERASNRWKELVASKRPIAERID